MVYLPSWAGAPEEDVTRALKVAEVNSISSVKCMGCGTLWIYEKACLDPGRPEALAFSCVCSRTYVLRGRGPALLYGIKPDAQRGGIDTEEV